MFDKRIFVLPVLLFPVLGPAQDQDADSEAASATDEPEVSDPDQEPRTRAPTRFVPEETISPDQIISFPADI